MIGDMLNGESANLKRILAVVILLAVAVAFPAAAEQEETILQVSGDALDQYWISSKRVQPQFSREAASQKFEGCITLGYVINEEGQVEHPHALVAYPSEDMIKPTLAAMKRWRYEAAEENTEKTPVYTTLTMTFLVNRDGGQAKAMSNALEKICVETAKQEKSSGSQ